MTLVLVRHGQSEWNLKNLFTGWYDAKLTDLGRSEALSGAKSLIANGQTEFDIAFTSDLSRAQDTCKIILTELGLDGKIDVKKDEALNERNYGDLTGLNKDDAKAKWGAEQVHIWRRSYDVPPPGKTGESLELTAARTLPYYFKEILPAVLKDHPNAKVLVAAHGNSLRSIIMHLEGISKDDITGLELETGVPLVYTLDTEGKVLTKKILTHKHEEKTSGEKE